MWDGGIRTGNHRGRTSHSLGAFDTTVCVGGVGSLVNLKRFKRNVGKTASTVHNTLLFYFFIYLSVSFSFASLFILFALSFSFSFFCRSLSDPRQHLSAASQIKSVVVLLRQRHRRGPHAASFPPHLPPAYGDTPVQQCPRRPPHRSLPRRREILPAAPSFSLAPSDLASSPSPWRPAPPSAGSSRAAPRQPAPPRLPPLPDPAAAASSTRPSGGGRPSVDLSPEARGHTRNREGEAAEGAGEAAIFRLLRVCH
jgi:hypothetical protein